MSNIVFVTYSSSIYKKNIFWNKLFVNLFIRPDISLFLTDDDLKKDGIYEENKEVFDASIGGGYWAWKPWAILKAFEQAEDGDIVLYQDCGKGFKYKNFRKPTNIIKYALSNDVMPGVLVPIHGENKLWTHSTCFELMGCNNIKYHNSPQVEAVVSAWKVGGENKAFIKEWLSYCLNIKIISDSNGEADSKFICHRYDQSILTNLVIKRNLKPVRMSFDDLHFSKSMSLVDIDLGNEFWGNKLLLYIILNLFRLKRGLVDVFK